jgi:antirestriction protein ArdC
LTEQERAERRARDLQLARQAVEQLRTSEGWTRWLQIRASFTSYSPTNQLLISLQNPAATRVAGFRAWLKLGYCPAKGSKAIRIWAPCPPTRKQLHSWQQNGADPQARPRTFFKLVPVFAQDAVVPLPPPAVPAPLDPPIHDVAGEELADRIPALVDLAEQIGSTVTFATVTGGAHGYYQPSSRRIVVEQALSGNQRVKTLAHELAHALVRADRHDSDPTLDYAAEELVAESVAWTCLKSVGVDPAGYSIPYLASWAESSDLGVLERTAGLIDRLAHRIETALSSASQSTIATDTDDVDMALIA